MKMMTSFGPWFKQLIGYLIFYELELKPLHFHVTKVISSRHERVKHKVVKAKKDKIFRLMLDCFSIKSFAKYFF